MRPINRIILHCTDTEDGDVESIRKFHVEQRGWADIGYHFVIPRSGVLQEGRPVEQEGAHCKGENADSIGVALVGKDTFRLAQIRTLVHICKVLMLQFNLNHHHVRCHYEFASAKQQGKTCPNFDIDTFRYFIRQLPHVGA